MVRSDNLYRKWWLSAERVIALSADSLQEPVTRPDAACRLYFQAYLYSFFLLIIILSYTMLTRTFIFIVAAGLTAAQTLCVTYSISSTRHLIYRQERFRKLLCCIFGHHQQPQRFCLPKSF